MLGSREEAAVCGSFMTVSVLFGFFFMEIYFMTSGNFFLFERFHTKKVADLNMSSDAVGYVESSPSVLFSLSVVKFLFFKTNLFQQSSFFKAVVKRSLYGTR